MHRAGRLCALTPLQRSTAFVTLPNRRTGFPFRRQFAVTRDFPAEDLGLQHIAGTKDKSKVDLIAIHGLAANPHETWVWNSQAPEPGKDRHAKEKSKTSDRVNWLKDILPKQLPNVSIKTYNYASDWLVDAPKETLRGIALRLLSSLHEEHSRKHDSEDGDEKKSKPLIFLGHSFGGLVIQEALVLAAQYPKYRDILLRTHAVFFLGTPHRGSSTANLATVLTKCADAFGMGSSTALLKKLQEDADAIRNTVSDFVIQAREYDIDLVCFYELYETCITTGGFLFPEYMTLVVDQDSATLPGWRAMGLTTDHCGLNKYKSKNDANYRIVLSKLKERVKEAPSAINKKVEHHIQHKPMGSKFYIVPHMRSSSFRPRASITKKVQEILREAEDMQDHEQMRFALYGLPGGGKTQRALTIAHSLKEQGHVFWVNASSIDDFDHTMTTIARKVHPTEQQLTVSQHDLMRATRDWLESPRSGRWLLVVDGIGNCTPDFMGYLEDYLPHARGTVLFTSTTAQIISTVGSPDFAIEVPPMDYSDGASLFKLVSGVKDETKREMEELLEHLEYVPLAITQAASYVRAREIPVADYLSLLKDAEDHSKSVMFEASRADPHDYTSRASRSVMTTWSVALNHIEQINPNALALLNIMSLLGPNIPANILEPFKNTDIISKDNVAFQDAIGLLLSYRLIAPSRSHHFSHRTFRLHSLASLRARIRMGPSKAQLVALALAAVDSIFPDPDGTKRNIQRCRGVVQHAETLLKHSAEMQECEELRIRLKAKIDLHEFYAYEYSPDGFAALMAVSRRRGEEAAAAAAAAAAVEKGKRERRAREVAEAS